MSEERVTIADVADASWRKDGEKITLPVKLIFRDSTRKGEQK